MRLIEKLQVEAIYGMNSLWRKVNLIYMTEVDHKESEVITWIFDDKTIQSMLEMNEKLRQSLSSVCMCGGIVPEDEK